MGGRKLKIEQGVMEERDVMRGLFSEEMGAMKEDRFEASNEEHAIFTSVFHGADGDQSTKSCEKLSYRVSIGENSIHLKPSNDVPSESMRKHLNCHIVESFEKSILSSYYQFNSQVEMDSDTIDDIDDDDALHAKSKKQHIEGGIVSSKRPEFHVENERKRQHGLRINDDDLLISAVIKNKKIRFGAKSLSISQPEALKKLKSQKGSCRLKLRTPLKGGNLGTKTVLCWLIEMGALSVKDILHYRDPKTNEVLKEGWVTRDGILCNCCGTILSLSEFMAHAGFKLQKPSLNLFLESGKPFSLCQFEAWSAECKGRKGYIGVTGVEEEDRNDDICGLCGDGGELVCCDNCPSTYHHACLPSQEIPEGSWYCNNCICQICEDVVTQTEASSSLAMLQCLQCDFKYHNTCIKDKVTSNAEVASGTWFCGESCQEVYLGLRSRVGMMNDIGDGFSWSILRSNHDDRKIHSSKKIAASTECNIKLAVALTIMEECFLPMVDLRTGIDIIPQCLYNCGSNFSRLSFHGFYTAVLEKNDEVVSIASVRVHGVTVAEMPLLATCTGRRRQGMCRRLLNEVEKVLRSLKVKLLVVSAIPELIDTWTSGFGFKPLDDDDKQQLKNFNFMLFQGTSMLMKNL